jgi:tetratricopeptide (TPR) repeat protein
LIRLALTVAVLALAPGMAVAQAGLGAWDFEHGGGMVANEGLGANASGTGVGHPNSLPGAAAPLTAAPEARYDPEIEYTKGYVDLGYGKYLQAQEEFGHALKVDPHNPKTLFMLGVAYSAAGDVRRAAGAWAKALKYDPQQIDARREYAVALHQLGKSDQAQAQYAILKAHSEACAAACPQAENYKASLARIETALAAPIANR